LEPLVAAIRRESPKAGIAPSNAFVLVEWCSILVQNLAGTPLWEKFGKEITLATAEALDKCCSPASKAGVARSALVVTRRGYRKLFTVAGNREETITESVQSLSAKAAQPAPKNAIMLGVIAGVCSRQPESKPILEKLKSEYFTFYTREIVGSKSPVPKYLAAGLGDFFSDFVTPEELEKEVVASLKKGLLRAPEVVLNDLITPLISSLPSDWDLSDVLHGHLLKPLLSNLQSSNAVIRAGAVNAFRVVAERCRNTGVMDKVADDILTPLKGGKLASPDHRVLHCELLLALPVSGGIAGKIVAALPTPIGKEGNEAALNAETSALSRAVKALLAEESELPKAVADVFSKGLADKKLSSRRIWTMNAGGILESFKSDESRTSASVKFAELTLPALLDNFNDVVGNPLKASQDGTIIAAYVVCAVAPLILKDESNEKLKALSKKFSVSKQCLELQPKPSFLLNPRVYTKVSLDDDARWLLGALSAVAPSLPTGNSSDVGSAWAHALFYLICSTTISPKLRKEAADKLSTLYLSAPAKVAGIVVGGVWSWIRAVATTDKDSAPVLAKIDNGNLHTVLRSICLVPADLQRASEALSQEELEQQMCSVLVFTRSRLIPRISWIEVCLRTGVDPGELAKKYEKTLLEEIVKHSDFSQPVSKTRMIMSRQDC
jgi:hypothetical protein